MSALRWLVVFLSLHACNARHLFHREKVGKDLYNPRKEVEDHKSRSLSSTKSSFIEVNITEKDRDNKDDASKTKHKEPCMEEDNLIKGKKGKKTEVSSSSQEVLQMTINLKEKCKKDERRKLGEELEEAKENANSNSMEGEDIDVMDYVQPHRKPPIHNKEP